MLAANTLTTGLEMFRVKSTTQENTSAFVTCEHVLYGNICIYYEYMLEFNQSKTRASRLKRLR